MCHNTSTLFYPPPLQLHAQWNEQTSKRLCFLQMINAFLVCLFSTLVSVAAYGFWHMTILPNRSIRDDFYAKYNANKA